MTGDPIRQARDAGEFALDPLQEDIELGVRAVEMRVRQLMSDFETERVALIDRLEEEQNRVRERDFQLAAARQDAERLRGHLASVEARLARHEKDLDALEDEIDLMFTRVEARALGALQESEARTKEVIEAKAEAEREFAERFRRALREQEETAARAQAATVEAHRAEITALTTEKDEAHRAQMTALTTENDRLNSELRAIKLSMYWRLTHAFRRSSE